MSNFIGVNAVLTRSFDYEVDYYDFMTLINEIESFQAIKVLARLWRK